MLFSIMGDSFAHKSYSPALVKDSETYISMEPPHLSENRGLVSATKRKAFEAKYEQKDLLGKGGCGSVYGGYRRADNLPVAIKHIPKENVVWTDTDEIGQRLTIEVAAMLKLQTESADSVGKSAPISLLDWYDFDQEQILVLERPVPAVDLSQFIENNKEPLQENQAKTIIKQLVDDTNIFHRDIKPKNILIETGSEIPRLRLIDFGLSCFTDTEYEDGWFYGTAKHAPPEYISECVYEAGPATVWQVGIVLYEMLHESFFDSRKLLDNELRIRTDLSTDCKRFLKSCFCLSPGWRPTLKELQILSFDGERSETPDKESV
uniref:Serine/threonine-protein kinase n=1 Tax=Nothobranchius furzeri TaxID=105023 RepID=A0A8C6PYS4_NOTFU